MFTFIRASAASLALWFVVACSSEPQAVSDEELTKWENQLHKYYTRFGNQLPEEGVALAKKIIRVYKQRSEQLAEKAPEEAAKALYKAAGIYHSVLRQPHKALSLYQQIGMHFSETKIAAQAAFLYAYILANEIKNYEMAKKAYYAFIQKYPNHPLVEAAKQELQVLGKSPEEILDSLQQKSSVP